MLTVKIMTPGGGEEIHSGKSIGYNPEQQSISIVGNDNTIWLKANQVAYVMNESGKTISHYSYSEKAGEIRIHDGDGACRAVMKAMDVEEKVVSKAEFRELLKKNRSPSGWNFINPNARSITIGNIRYIES